MSKIEFAFRWLHVIAGITWIGHLYFFNFVNAPMQALLDDPTKKAVNPQLMPRYSCHSRHRQSLPGFFDYQLSGFSVRDSV